MARGRARGRTRELRKGILVAISVTEYNADRFHSFFKGTATANTDDSGTVENGTLHMPTPCRTFTVQGTRPTSGNFTFTLEGSLDGAAWSTLATCTVTGGTANMAFAVDKPVKFAKVLFTDVGSATVTWRVCGVV